MKNDFCRKENGGAIIALPPQKAGETVHWIAIHENVLGSKLRGLRKRLKCSEAEALGILTILWLWARKNADRTGLLANTDREDIADEIKKSIRDSLDPSEVTEAMIEEGWIDDIDGTLYIHDWSEWQDQWYSYLDKRKKDTERKREERARKKLQAENQADAQQEEQADVQEIKEEKKPEPPKEPKKPKAEKPPKTKYADNVSMYPEEHQKLVDRFGEEFTRKCIEILDNYKPNGKKYKDDYRAILTWVVDRCEEKYPYLKKKQTTQNSQGNNVNPFASYK